MSDLLAARSQMGVSLAFHIVFAVVGIATPVMIVVAVSGAVLSFELGLLWPGFMGLAGSIIGMPFSLEGFAFFTEAIFLGVYLYGWAPISPRAHLGAGVAVALSGAASGIFVVLANAWMNAPTGFELVAGR